MYVRHKYGTPYKCSAANMAPHICSAQIVWHPIYDSANMAPHIYVRHKYGTPYMFGTNMAPHKCSAQIWSPHICSALTYDHPIYVRHIIWHPIYGFGHNIIWHPIYVRHMYGTPFMFGTNMAPHLLFGTNMAPQYI